MLKITDINWLSKEALEAEVTLTNGKFELMCFLHPFNYKLNSEFSEHLYCYELSNILKEKIREFNISKLNSAFSYRITGKLINKKDGIILF